MPTPTRYSPPSIAFDPKSYPKRKPPPKDKPRPIIPDMPSVEREADSIIAELLAELGLARGTARQEAERSAQQEIQRAQALSEALRSLGVPQQIQGIYQSAAGAVGGLAQGFSGETRGLAEQQAAEMANMLSGTGQEGAVRSEGAAMGDVLYGSQGFIPARGLEQTGAAFASEAALQPGFALQFGQIAANEAMQQYLDEVLPEFTAKEAEIRTKRPSIVQEIRDRRKQEATQLYEAGLLTQREYARRMGMKDWRKFSERRVGEEAEDRPKASASLSKALGYLVDEHGSPILNSKGKPIGLPRDPNVERFGSASAGYWAWNPETGEIVNLLPPKPDKPRDPANYQSKNIGGKTYIFDPNTGIFYDPKTGRPTVPKGSQGSSKRKFTPSQVQDFKGQSHSLAEDYARGIPAEQTEDGVEVPSRTYGEAIQEALRSGIPLNIFIPILNRYYPPGVGGRPIKPSPYRGYAEGAGRSSGPKGEPAKGGRQDASFTGASSLTPSAVPLMAAALSQGFTNLGTHNPASRLPGGGISDHAKYPAEAFDIGGFSGGWGNAKARRMFQWLIRQPGVKYVILGDKIWSRSRGLHAYTSGGHDGHIHVSVYAGETA